MLKIIFAASVLLATPAAAQTAQPVTPPAPQGMAPNGAATTPPPAGSPMNPGVVTTQGALAPAPPPCDSNAKYPSAACPAPLKKPH